MHFPRGTTRHSTCAIISLYLENFYSITFDTQCDYGTRVLRQATPEKGRPASGDADWRPCRAQPITASIIVHSCQQQSNSKQQSMSFLDVLKSSIGANEPVNSSSKKENLPSSASSANEQQTPPPQQVEYSSDIDSLSHSSPESSKSTSARRRSPSTRSCFTKLSCEITQFQKMIRELESLVKLSGDTPENQWRSRIILRSAEEADRDIGKKI